MKVIRRVLFVAMVAFVANSSFAGSRYIETPSEQIILQEAKCKTGGQEAMLISKSRGGGGYGCWEEKDGYVYVKWTTSIGADGSTLRLDTIIRYKAP